MAYATYPDLSVVCYVVTTETQCSCPNVNKSKRTYDAREISPTHTGSYVTSYTFRTKANGFKL